MSLKRLEQLQQQFQAYLLSGSESFLSQIVGDDKSHRKMRADVYADGYQWRLTDIVAMDFPALEYLMGKEFELLARQYVKYFPSYYYSAQCFNQHLAGYLLKHSCYQDFPEYAQMAEFEWQLETCWSAADSGVVKLSDLQAINQSDWLELRFHCVPSLSTVTLNYNIPNIWQSINEQQANIVELLKNDQPETWVIWRRGLERYYHQLTPAMSFMISAIKKNQSFSQLCEGLCQWYPEDQVPQQVLQLLMTLINQEQLSAVYIKSQ